MNKKRPSIDFIKTINSKVCEITNSREQKNEQQRLEDYTRLKEIQQEKQQSINQEEFDDKSLSNRLRDTQFIFGQLYEEQKGIIIKIGTIPVLALAILVYINTKLSFLLLPTILIVLLINMVVENRKFQHVNQPQRYVGGRKDRLSKIKKLLARIGFYGPEGYTLLNNIIDDYERELKNSIGPDQMNSIDKIELNVRIHNTIAEYTKRSLDQKSMEEIRNEYDTLRRLYEMKKNMPQIPDIKSAYKNYTIYSPDKRTLDEYINQIPQGETDQPYLTRHLDKILESYENYSQSAT